MEAQKLPEYFQHERCGTIRQGMRRNHCGEDAKWSLWLETKRSCWEVCWAKHRSTASGFHLLSWLVSGPKVESTFLIRRVWIALCPYTLLRIYLSHTYIMNNRALVAWSGRYRECWFARMGRNCASPRLRVDIVHLNNLEFSKKGNSCGYRMINGVSVRADSWWISDSRLLSCVLDTILYSSISPPRNESGWRVWLWYTKCLFWYNRWSLEVKNLKMRKLGAVHKVD